MDADAAILVDALDKRYGRAHVLDDINLCLPRGQVHAIVGANGAGKSTLFRILLGFLAPDSGASFVLGRDSRRLTPKDRGRIGYVNEEHALPGWMQVRQLTRMQRHQYPTWQQDAFDEVIAHYRLRPGQAIGALSRGERAGFNLALALAQRPELLILDEPTLGLDVVAKRAFLEALLYSQAIDGCTIVYCSHQMDEVERVAENLVVMEAGKIRAVGAPEAFCSRVTHWIADIPFRGPSPDTIPGLLEARKLDGLHHYMVLDQDQGFADFLRAAGARSAHSMPVNLDRAIDAFLARDHAKPQER